MFVLRVLLTVDLHPIFTHFCMSELTLPDAARSNTVKQLDRRNRGNLKCKYMLFLVQISMQMHTKALLTDKTRCYEISRRSVG